jgi:methylglutaconyl-CoA hydratase
VARPDELDAIVEQQLGMLLKGGPFALRESKELIFTVEGGGVSADIALKRRTAQIIAQLRVSDEGQEGLAAFLEKRPPNWVRAEAQGNGDSEDKQ